ncbi:hypothetical protein EMIHUDRAFT_453173 [Emiliania huxleyi CCMP1516]|uniref:Uncharacterized protein n=2 Tax=Emiliania huxleyi TaxID=2903 RepID=A0A0D3IA65_EMIH1|nr:hypothetical protein EMIHUDRAFT_453173 [Emiliania huxleyi CCMP1516]EOD08150.1 hypothetical protein EMIHUDRAFT_453173 [Emiliania huxleyi CCMP1516]|eukprot:XP_005760579.1 hypothetical protein EMIHUDRAFT_453173 [Emiliania huxleyi CCMP1516]
MTDTQPACQVASPRGIRRSMSKPFARRRETLRERTCPAADDEETSGPSGNRRIRHTLSRPFWNNKGRKQCVSRTVPPYEDCAPPPPPLSPYALPLSPQRTLAAGPPPPETVAQTPPQSEPPSSPQPDVTQTPQSEPPCSPPPEGAPTHKRTRSVAKSKPFWEIKMDKAARQSSGSLSAHSNRGSLAGPPLSDLERPVPYSADGGEASREVREAESLERSPPCEGALPTTVPSFGDAQRLVAGKSAAGTTPVLAAGTTPVLVCDPEVSLSEWEARVLGMVEKEAGERGAALQAALPCIERPSSIDVRELIARFEHITAAEERGDRSAMQRRDAAGGWPCLDCFKTANQSPPVL